jgi:hypothetical protein
LKFGGEYAFGSKGKPSAPGKPRIPPNADVEYEVELVELPGIIYLYLARQYVTYWLISGKGEDFILDYE